MTYLDKKKNEEKLKCGKHGQRVRSKTEGNFEMLIWWDYSA